LFYIDFKIIAAGGLSVCFIKAGADFLNAYKDAETSGIIIDTMK